MKNRFVHFFYAAIACLALLLSGCAAHEAQDAARNFSTSALEQVFLLAVFGSDALEDYNEDKYREWYWRTTPYRRSFTRETYLEMQKRLEFEELYESLAGSRYGTFSSVCSQSSGDPARLYCGSSSRNEVNAISTLEGNEKPE